MVMMEIARALTVPVAEPVPAATSGACGSRNTGTAWTASTRCEAPRTIAAAIDANRHSRNAGIGSSR